MTTWVDKLLRFWRDKTVELRNNAKIMNERLKNEGKRQ
jgi:hypothetical protein